MKSIFPSLLRMLVAFGSLFLLGGPCATAAEDETGFAAKIWPLDAVPPVSGVAVLEQLRKQTPPAAVTRLTLDTLVIPARDQQSYARVTGALVAPESADYKFSFTAEDPAELWMENPETGEWELVQQNRTSKRDVVKMKQGVPRRFQLWTWGRGQVAVAWRGEKSVVVPKKVGTTRQLQLIVDETIPLSRSFSGQTKIGHSHGDGLRVGWKRQMGLNADSDEGPDSCWGDPDGDGLLNWQEQMVGSDPLKADAGGRVGLVLWELWRNVPGPYVFDLTREAKFPDEPDEVHYLSRMEMTVRHGDNYGARMRALLQAPISGDYTFMIMADDNAELWLSTTESPAERQLIAKVEQTRGNYEWPRFDWERRLEAVKKALLPEQISAKVTLKQGQSYYVEVLHKQFRDQDSCSVAWMVPGAKTPQVVGGTALTSQRRQALPPGLAEKVEQTVAKRLTCDFWDKLPGGRLSDLYRSKLYPAQPTQTKLIDNPEFTSEGDNYGCRLRGFLTAPDDGPYTFHISGNDACLLFLAPSEDKFTKQLLVETRRDTGWRNYERNFSQHSKGIVLKKGQKYYIEVLFKRGELEKPDAANTDHASVAWTRPGRQRTIIDSAYFSPYQRDARDRDDDDLPDAWEAAHGLDHKDPVGNQGAWGDPDGDLLENLREFQAGLDPQMSDVQGAPGLVLWQRWGKLKGGISALRASPAFPTHPTDQKWIGKLEGSSGWDNFYGSRMRAFVIPPTTGDYTFAIAGRNQGELWLSPNEQKADRQKIAQLSRWTGFRQWDKDPGQVSRGIRLEAGQRYFIEALHHQGPTGRDHVSVAWKVPGAEEFAIIEGSALAGFAGDPNDVDDDDLPDDWEKANGLSIGSNDAEQDPDGDGLTNREEYLYGTNPQKADTNGDGVSDLDTSMNLGLLHAGAAVFDVGLDSFVSASAHWTLTSGGLLSDNFRGDISWKFTVPGDGYWLLRLKTELMGLRMGSEQIPMRVMVDGQEVARRDLYFGVGKLATLQALTPYLTAGEHQVTVLMDNLLARRTVRLISLIVYEPGQVMSLLGKANHTVSAREGTRTSPYCLEGYAREVSSVRVNGQAATSGLGDGHWYVNLPLAPVDGGQLYIVEYERNSTTKGAVAWVPTNALAGETLTIRQGDSLRVGAWSGAAAGTSMLVSSDGESWKLTGQEATVVPFPEAGIFTFTGTTQDGTAGTLTVKVCAAPGFLPRVLDTLHGTTRTMTLNADQAVTFETARDLANLSVTRSGKASATLGLLPLVARELGLVARMGIGGPILAVQPVNVIGFTDAKLNSMTSQSASNIAGYKLYSTPLTVTNLPEGGRVDISIFRAGVMFPNGSTVRSVYPKDLTNGSVVLQFLYPLGMPGAFCHHLLIYDRVGKYLGTR